MVIRPSGLALTVACAASVVLQASMPTPPMTDEQAEGHAWHFIARMYAGGWGPRYPVGTCFDHSERSWTVTSEMISGALLFSQAMGGPHNDLRLEDPVACPDIHPSCAGTPDAWRFFPSYVFPEDVQRTSPELPSHPVRLVRVGDYKGGHRYVEAYGCYQTTSYASGVMHLLQLTDNDEFLWLELIIVQPRSYHREGPVRVWRGPASMLRAYINIARQAADEALSPYPIAHTNDACIDCDARHVCRTLQVGSLAFADFSSAPEIVNLPAAALGFELALVDDALSRLKARRTGLAAQVEAILHGGGETVPHYHMEPGGSDLTWRDNVKPAEVTGLGDLLGIELRKTQALITPTQAIERGIDREVINSYAHRPRAALKLARDNSTHIRKVFNK